MTAATRLKKTLWDTAGHIPGRNVESITKAEQWLLVS